MSQLTKHILIIIAFAILTPIYAGIYFYINLHLKVGGIVDKPHIVMLFSIYWMAQTYVIFWLMYNRNKYSILLSLPYLLFSPLFFSRYNWLSMLFMIPAFVLTIIYSYILLGSLMANITREYQEYRDTYFKD